MAKKLQLQVPVPCHEDWEKMTHAEKGRFCSSCQKTVIDFSNMSDREIALFFKKPSIGSVCGRFLEDQLNRDMCDEIDGVLTVGDFYQKGEGPGVHILFI